MRIQLFLFLFLAALASAFTARSRGDRYMWNVSFDHWRTDEIWFDGQAEKCVYRATRTIYGKERDYDAIAYTDKEKLDPATTTKSATDAGILTFKHHWSEIIPTENYAYRFSTCIHTGADTLQTEKFTVGTQEDCGASFKLATHQKTGFDWFDSVYFPGAGQRNGTLPGAFQTHFVDELPLLLRDYDFEHPADKFLLLVPSQKDTHQVDWTPFPVRVMRTERATLEVPMGKLDAQHLLVQATKGDWHADYWFAADGKPPLLHVLLKYVGPDGQTYALKSQERTAYWKH